MPVALRCVHRAAALLGEGPVWVAEEQALYWVDIHGRRIHRFHPATAEVLSYSAPFRIASLAPRAGGGFVAGSERGFLLIDRALKQFTAIGEPEPDLPGNRFNDGKLDPHGHFWAGTMDDAEQATSGALYRLDPDLSWHRMDGPYEVPNGPAFSPDGSVLYHSDSAARVVYRFRLAPDGGIADKTVFRRFEEADGFPDGMTTDAEGNVWIAFWDGWCLRRFSPNGELLMKVDLPVQRPTSCVFGGGDLTTLFVTSARVGLSNEALDQQPLAGALFALDNVGRGWPATEFAA